MSGMKVKVQKKNPAGKVTYEYEGELLSHEGSTITIEALFDRADMPFQDVVFKRGDRFVEYYYTDRWYNIFAIHDREDDSVKGWYCNIGKPAVIQDGFVSYVDLALDLWVSVSGKQTVLDEDEFRELGLDAELEQKALTALRDLQTYFETKRPPQ
jgi:predicted RNA-binding protein associated with RNAse of E/G family